MDNLIVRLKSILKRHRIILQNFKYVAVLQIFNILIPLITYPYLIRILGSEIYGLVIFAQALVGYFVMLIGFGFNISATKEISIHRDSKEKVSEIVSSVLIIKGILFFLSALLFSLTLLFIDNSEEYQILFYITFYLCLYEWLFPFWYFQGIEQMKYITYLNIISRTVFLLLIFVLVKGKADYLFFPIVSGLGSLLSTILALYIMFKKHNIYFVFPRLQTLKVYFRNSIPIFSSNLSLKLYTGSNKVVIGMVLGMQEVAFYDLGEKLLNLLKIPIASLSQVLFPNMAYAFDKNLLVKIAKINVAFSLFLTLILLLFLEYIIRAIGGIGMLGAMNTVTVLVLSITPVVLSNIFGVQTLLTNGYNKQFFKVVFSSFCFYALYVSAFYFLSSLNLITISFSILTTEIFMLIGFAFFVRKYKLL